MAFKIPRSAYADMFGPTTGDRVRLADTEWGVLIVEGCWLVGLANGYCAVEAVQVMVDKGGR